MLQPGHDVPERQGLLVAPDEGATWKPELAVEIGVGEAVVGEDQFGRDFVVQIRTVGIKVKSED